MSLRYAILGFLSHSPMTGYELKKHMGHTVAHFWTADQAQIYRTLTALAKDGHVAVETEAQDARPNKQVHSILPKGQAELDAWLASPLDPSPSREPFLMRLFFAGRMGPDLVRDLLKARLREVDEFVAALEAIPGADAGDNPDLAIRMRLATLSNGLAHARAERDWAQALLNELETKDV